MAEPSPPSCRRAGDLPSEIKQGIVEKKITEGHARAILSEKNIERQIALFHEIVKKKLTVRQAEQLSKKVPVSSHTRTITQISPVLADRIGGIERSVGSKVKLSQKGDGGKISIEYFSEGELESILNRLEDESGSHN